MAHIRRYASQGDPLPRSILRGGLLVRSPFPSQQQRIMGRGPRTILQNLATHPLGFRRKELMFNAGDPFLGKLFKKAGKALKKVTLKGVVKAVGNVAKFAAPLVLPGIGGALAGALIPGPREPEPVAIAPELLEPATAAPPAFDPQELQMLMQWWQEQQLLAQMQAEQQRLQQEQLVASLGRFGRSNRSFF